MLETHHNGDYLVVRVCVDTLDMRLTAEFQTAFGKVLENEDGFVLLDLSMVQFMDSSGLAAFISCFHLAEIKEQLALIGVTERVQKLFDLTRVGEVVRIFVTEQDACSALQGSTG